MRTLAAGLAALALVVVGCGNFFPNPGNVVLPSGVRDYELVCGNIAHGECETRAAGLVESKRSAHPGVRVVKVELQERGSYTITFADGTIESMIVD